MSDSPRPSKDQLLAYIRENPGNSDRRDLARAFDLKGSDRSWLRATLKQMSDEGLVQQTRKQLSEASDLPRVMLLEVDEDAEHAHAVEQEWREQELVFTLRPNRMLGRPEPGERVLCQIETRSGEHFAKPFKRLPKPKTRIVVGRFSGGQLEPSDRRAKSNFHVSIEDINDFDLGDGDLVKAETIDDRAFGLQPVRVLEVIATAQEAQRVSAFSLISAVENNLRLEFPEAVINEAEELGPPTATGRTDLREVPLVTIDGADARDFDDAIWAEPVKDEAGELVGHRLLVAIADVAGYVAPNSALDKEALKRGNSTYFPDRVIPMLPEALSNGWCSLVPNEDRGCLAVDMQIDLSGKLKRYKFLRGIMRSHARLIYEDVEATLDGDAGKIGQAVWQSTVQPAFEAYQVLKAARETRGALDIDVPEQVVVLDESHSRVMSIAPRARLQAHQLIEEFMVLANVAAATALEAKNQACMYRLHVEPDPIKLDSLKQMLEGTPAEISGKKGLDPRSLNAVLAKIDGLDYAPMIHEAVLRSQMQAYYGPTNIGHFGLSLAKYAHFTSPIRRYADLLVHRALIQAYGLGSGGEPLGLRGDAKRIGEMISWTERQSVLAERAANDRYLSAYLAESVGEIIGASVNSTTSFGLFMKLDRGGAHAFLPMSLLDDDRYRLDQTGTALIGERWGKVLRVGQRAQVKVLDVDPLTGSITVSAEDWQEGGGLPFKPKAERNSPFDRRGKGGAKGSRGNRGAKGGKGGKPKTTSARARKEAKRKQARAGKGLDG